MYHRELSSVLCDDLEGWCEGRREIQEGGDVHIHIADSLHCTMETNTTFQSHHMSIFKRKLGQGPPRQQCSLSWKLDVKLAGSALF